MLKIILCFFVFGNSLHASETVDTTLTEVLAGNSTSFVISPSSLKSVLNLLAVGAKGQTKSQLQTLLKSADSADKKESSAKSNSKGEDFILKSILKIWIEKSFPVLDLYKNSIATQFKAEVESADFKHKADDEKTKINTWVEKQTNDKIKELIPAGILKSNTRLVLVNAIYFLSQWEKPFDPDLTKKNKFTRINSSATKIPYMRQNFHGLKYFEDADMQAVSIPYKGGAEIIIALPKKRELKSLVSKSLALTDKSFNYHEVDVEIPKFKIEFQTDFSAFKKQLNIEDTFSFNADFSGISNEALKEKLHVSNILQKAVIIVDEKGTEATAATAAIMGFGALKQMNPPKNFIANHPFLFMIRKSNENLFVGVFND